jgi:hypothetical protein
MLKGSNASQFCLVLSACVNIFPIVIATTMHTSPGVLALVFELTSQYLNLHQLWRLRFYFIPIRFLASSLSLLSYILFMESLAIPITSFQYLMIRHHTPIVGLLSMSLVRELCNVGGMLVTENFKEFFVLQSVAFLYLMWCLLYFSAIKSNYGCAVWIYVFCVQWIDAVKFRLTEDVDASHVLPILRLTYTIFLTIRLLH